MAIQLMIRYEYQGKLLSYQAEDDDDDGDNQRKRKRRRRRVKKVYNKYRFKITCLLYSSCTQLIKFIQ
jgi:hypothetical protein